MLKKGKIQDIKKEGREDKTVKKERRKKRR
jgi:hypothetical protein